MANGGGYGEKVMNLLGTADTKILIDAMDGPKEHAQVAVTELRNIMAKDEATKQAIIWQILADGLDNAIATASSAALVAAKLQGEHNEVMSGKSPGCRHLTLLEKSFWKGVVVSLLIPIIMLVLGGLLMYAYFHGH